MQTSKINAYEFQISKRQAYFCTISVDYCQFLVLQQFYGQDGNMHPCPTPSDHALYSVVVTNVICIIYNF